MADRLKQVVALGILSLSVLWIHYGISRHESAALLLTYSLGFISYVWVLRSKINYPWILIPGALLRILLVFGLPTLSEDVYRFIWDGHLLHAGIHPFSAVPEDIYLSKIDISGLSDTLYQSLNSQPYHTIYPPLSQAVFWLATLSKDLFTNITIIRLIILAFEAGVLWLLHLHFNPSQSGGRLALYALNPLVILELTGNLHFEGIVVFFLLLSIILIRKAQWWGTAISFAVGIGVKLVPLMFLPALITKTSFKKSLVMYLIIGVASVVLFLPLMHSSFFTGMTSSLSLFFLKFEFNAGLFFLVREIGFWVVGFDLVHIVGPIFSLLSLSIILWYSFKNVTPKSDLTHVFSTILFIQFTLSMVVHPWYIVPLIALAVGSRLIFPIVWSFFIFMTYAGYGVNSFEHPMLWIAIEYLIVGYFAWKELIHNREFPFIHE